MARVTWKDHIDAPSGQNELYEGFYGYADDFKYGDKVVVTVEHGEGTVTKLEHYYETMLKARETDKDNLDANPDIRIVYDSLLVDLKLILENEPQ